MGVSLSKGGNLSLTKTTPGLKEIIVGCGWDARTTTGAAFDLDASALLVTETGKVRGDQDFIFYNQAVSDNGSVKHNGDNRTGDGDGDDETITIKLDEVPAAINKIVINVSIDQAAERGQSFGQVRNSYARVLNAADGVEIARYDLTEDASTETAMVFGEVYRENGGGWKFRAVGQGYASGLAGIAADFGISVD